MTIYAEVDFRESKTLRDSGSTTGALQVKFWHTMATTLSATKLFFAMTAILLLFPSQKSISSLFEGSM
jgi:hypothetical protein